LISYLKLHHGYISHVAYLKDNHEACLEPTNAKTNAKGTSQWQFVEHCVLAHWHAQKQMMLIFLKNL